MLFEIVLTICFINLSVSEDDKKWVWKQSDRRSDDIDGNRSVGKPRYEVIENESFRPEIFRPPPNFDRPDRPIGIHQELGFPDRPYPNRPELFVPNERPDGFGPALGINRPPGGFRPGGNNPEILTGPVPSWVKESPFKQYDKCKCAEKFNCNSPGISYGHCDVGKQYCCYHNKPHGALGGPLPNRPIHSPENGILVGPGPHRPFPGPSNRPPPRPHLSNDEVLVGPGGPTGIIAGPSRPFGGGGNVHGSGFGAILAPSGPYDGPFRPGGYGGSPFNYRGKSADTKDNV